MMDDEREMTWGEVARAIPILLANGYGWRLVTVFAEAAVSHFKARVLDVEPLPGGGWEISIKEPLGFVFLAIIAVALSAWIVRLATGVY
jgi:hypothetical protein